MSELRLSRARLVGVADAERRRIERDLHDGAQQQLIALAIKLGLLREQVDHGSAVARGLAEVQQGIEAALNDIRELAHGIYPQALQLGGLSQALPFIAGRLPLPITVQVDGLQRVAPEIETAIYFCCLESLQNVAKHATTQTPVDVRLAAHDGELRFSVVDSGPGFDPRSVRHGDGITGMRDRLGAIGGEIEISSTPGHGATITGRVPLSARVS